MKDSREPLTEFGLISRFFSRSSKNSTSHLVQMGVGDDCALLLVPPGQRLALSMDTVVEGRHFPAGASADDIGWRAVAVAASDLAAMGATPLAATLALTLPAVDEAWLARFSEGLYAALDHFELSLIGGDTTQGSLAITVQVHGLLSDHRALLRSGARVGDHIIVSGTLGDAAAALAMLQQRLNVPARFQDYLYKRFYRPEPRLALGQQLLNVASSAIDISDGLLADLGHILECSQVGARIDVERLPLSPVLSQHGHRDEALRWALAGGDDYELCFTVAPEQLSVIEKIAQSCEIGLAVVGEIVATDGVECVDRNGSTITFDSMGFQHFS